MLCALIKSQYLSVSSITNLTSEGWIYMHLKNSFVEEIDLFIQFISTKNDSPLISFNSRYYYTKS